MNERDSNLLDLIIDEVFGADLISTDADIGLKCRWNKVVVTEAIASVGTNDRYKVTVTIWAAPSGWVYGAVRSHKGIRTIPICPEAEFNKALWAGNAQWLPGMSELACMIN